VLYDLIYDDHSHDLAELSDEDRAALFGDLAASDPTDEELEAMAAWYESRMDADEDGRSEGHRDSDYWR
jgi:hypothetical protein